MSLTLQEQSKSGKLAQLVIQVCWGHEVRSFGVSAPRLAARPPGFGATVGDRGPCDCMFVCQAYVAVNVAPLPLGEPVMEGLGVGQSDGPDGSGSKTCVPKTGAPKTGQWNRGFKH